MTLQPIIPFEPISTHTIPSGEQWIAQIKWDGVRILTYYDGKQVKLYNRKKNERTGQYPELLPLSSYCQADSVILDGEMIALGSDGKPSFHEIMRRDAIRRLDRVQSMQRQVPVTYMIFDIIYYEGKWLQDHSLQERMDILERIIIPNEHVQFVPSHPDPNALYEVIKQQQMEGIVVKDVHSHYYIDGKNDKWQKVKVYRDLIAVVGGVTFRNQWVNAVLLGLYDEQGQLWYIGHAGTGKLTQKDWSELTRIVQQELITEERPFMNMPQRNKEAVWVRPLLTVKVQFLEWTISQTLRQPSIQAFVTANVDECTFASNGIGTNLDDS